MDVPIASKQVKAHAILGALKKFLKILRATPEFRWPSFLPAAGMHGRGGGAAGAGAAGYC